MPDLTQEKLKEMLNGVLRGSKQPLTEKDFSSFDRDSARKLVEELSTYRKELILQNDELMRTNAELQQVEKQYRDLYDRAPISYFSFNYQGEIVAANDAFSIFLGVHKSILIGKSLLDYIEPDSSGLFEFFLDALSHNTQHYRHFRQTLELTFFIRGKKVDTILYLSFYSDDGVPFVRAAIADVTEKNEIKHSLENEQRRYHIALESSSDYIFEYDILSDDLSYYGTPFDKSVPKTTVNRKHNFLDYIKDGSFCNPTDNFKVEAMLHGVSGYFELQIRSPLLGDAPYKWIEVYCNPVYNEKKLDKIIGRFCDIDEKKAEELRVLEADYRDELTGLNKAQRGLSLIDEFFRLNPKEKHTAFVLLNICNMNKINETHSPTFGNAVLTLVGDYLLSTSDEGSLFTRMGGDEFFILIKNTQKLDINKYVESVIKNLSLIYTGEDSECSLSARAVVALDVNANATSYVIQSLQYMHTKIKTITKNEILFIKADELSSFLKKSSNTNLDKSFNKLSPIFCETKLDVFSFAFDLLEKSKDTQSAINILLKRIGKEYNLDKIKIYEADPYYLARYLIFYWSEEKDESIQKIVHYPSLDVFNEIHSAFDDNGILDVRQINITGLKIETVEFLDSYVKLNALIGNMFRDGKITGVIFYEAKDKKHTWTDEEKHILSGLAKLISTHINRSRSDKATRAKTEFLSRISHEIRTPINGITGLVNLVKKQIITPPKDKTDNEIKKYLVNCLDKAEKTAHFLLSIINDVLEMSKIESGKLVLVKKAFKFSTVLDDMENMFHSELMERSLDYELTREGTDVPIIGDPIHISQVIVNLVSNAIKYTLPGGKISLCVKLISKDNENAKYYVSVKDTGIGISEKDKNRIFNSFEQVGTSSEKTVTGAGLGLSISSNIIQLMGSILKVDSELGKGSNFYFTLDLPITSEENIVQETHEFLESKEKKPIDFEEEKCETPNLFAGRNVLLVEDNKLNREIAFDLLEMEGFNVIAAEDGQIGVNIYKEKPENYFDLIIMDIRMPVMDGLTATSIIKNMGRADSRTIPVIAMTADVLDDNLDKSMECGMDGVVTKPVDMEQLKALIAKVLKININQ